MQPRSTTLGLRDLLLWSLCLPLAAALQQQPSNAAAYPSKGADRLSVASRYHAQDSLHTRVSGPHGSFRDTHAEKPRTSHDERALATLSPAESNPAGAPPAPRSSASTAGLSSRLPARSLQDWRVEDIILLATVDGKIHARDRATGLSRWQLETDRPMVETIYHPHNKSVDENGYEQEDPVWIVEPSQDGSIYMYAPGSGFGMQRLGYTVKQLAELAPYASEGQPALAYTAEKKTTLYTVDAGTGNILRQFSSSGTITNNEQSCRRVNPLAPLDEDECEPIGTLILGRTEYTIGVQDRNSGEQISTIKYFEWGPNNRDQDLQSKYTSTLDKKYVYTRHDGTIYGFDYFRPGPDKKPVFQGKLSSPVARVFDLVRPADDLASNTSLVLLPQPTGPSLDDLSELDVDVDKIEKVFVNCTSSGSCYALSEKNYPFVTNGATPAQADYERFFVPSIPLPKRDQEKFTGVHELASQPQQHVTPLIGAPEYPGIEAPPEEVVKTIEVAANPSADRRTPSMVTMLLVAILLGLLSCGILLRPRLGGLIGKQAAAVQEAAPISMPPSVDLVEQAVSETPMIRDGEPAQEIIFPHDQEGDDTPQAVRDDDASLVPIETNDGGDDEDASKDAKEPKNGKHKRGKRGGRKAKEKEQAQAEARARKSSQGSSPPPQPAEIISVAASESSQVSGPLQINSLIIHTDRVIGQGSCGTSVFEGSFEGRDVAVKRMLSQYYELASQEVSFLQQSDDHPNVVRYFCQQKDDHFLYIAVELCQASLFEVWEAEKAKTEERYQQLHKLKLTIQQDVPRTLQQLAAGLYHLHNLRIIHRDIKPQNILVAFPKRGQNNGPRLVISDFGLGKNLPENVSTLIDPTGNAGTSGWKAPELISQPRETDSKHSQSNSHTGGSEFATGGTSGVKRAADIFSLGCLFFWVLTDGIHPYEDENGWQQLRELNIKRDNKKMGVLERWSDAYEPMQLITSMLEHQPENRPTALQVLNHPFFWPSDKRLAFLCDVSDHFEREPRGIVDDHYGGDSAQLRLLESRAEEVIGAPFRSADFLAKLDRHFVDTLGKQRKYNGNRLLDLLRALRNKKNHYEDMPEDVKKRVGPLAGGYLSYWCHRFPRLLMACYEVVHEAGLQNGDRFRGYFVMGGA